MGARLAILMPLAVMLLACQSFVPSSTSPTLTVQPTSTRSGQPSTATPSPSPTPFDEFVDEGDSVTATGYIADHGTDSFILCRELAGGLTSAGEQGPPPACDRQWIALLGLPKPSGGQDYLKIDGTWIDHRLLVTASAPTEPPRLTVEVPCPTPHGGWPLERPDRAVRRLREHVTARPQAFGGSWTATSSYGEPVIVVGTTGAPEDVEADLEATTGFDICVTHVERSAAELAEIAAQIARPLRIDEAQNQVIVYVTVHSRELAETLEPFGDGVQVDAIATAARP